MLFWMEQKTVLQVFSSINVKPSLHMTWSSPRCPLRSHYLVCIENHLFIIGIGPILNKELKFIFRSDCSDRICVYT